MTSSHNNNIVVLLPPFDRNGYLPPGTYWTTWRGFVERFGKTAHRRKLLAGLKEAVELLRRAGCTTVYVGGSFVTRKRQPRDFDACWDSTGVDVMFLYRIERSLVDFSQGTAPQKTRFGGELFAAQAMEARSGKPFLEFFQTDQDGRPKGIVAIDLTR